MNKKRAQENADRQARLAAIQSKQRASERKRNTIIFGGITLVILSIIVAVAIVIVGQVQQNAALRDAAAQPIEGVEEFGDLSKNHTEEPVQYEQSPPVGGDHSPVWVNCGAYTEPLQDVNVVHSMEHGAVWITYQPELAQAEIDALTEVVGDRSYVLLSPYAGQDRPIMASGWGVQMSADTAADERLPAFLEKYAPGEQAPEPGAPCTGGIDPAA